jgi:hypothetical protein
MLQRGWPELHLQQWAHKWLNGPSIHSVIHFYLGPAGTRTYCYLAHTLEGLRCWRWKPEEAGCACLEAGGRRQKLRSRTLQEPRCVCVCVCEVGGGWSTPRGGSQDNIHFVECIPRLHLQDPTLDFVHAPRVDLPASTSPSLKM